MNLTDRQRGIIKESLAVSMDKLDSLIEFKEEQVADYKERNVYYDIAAEQLYGITVKQYAEYLEKFGTNPWLSEQDSGVLTDMEVPSIQYQGYRT